MKKYKTPSYTTEQRKVGKMLSDRIDSLNFQKDMRGKIKDCKTQSDLNKLWDTLSNFQKDTYKKLFHKMIDVEFGDIKGRVMSDEKGTVWETKPFKHDPDRYKFKIK